MTASTYPEFQLHLPHGGPVAHGQLLDELGTNDSHLFVVATGSPIRAEVVKSYATVYPSSYAFRQRLIEDGRIAESTTWPGYLETTADITCNSPSAAATIVLGRKANGWIEWRTADGHPLEDFLPVPSYGPNRAWLVRGSNVGGFDLVQRLWLPQGCVSLAADRLRDGVEQGITKDRLRSIVEEDYEATLTYNQRIRLISDLHVFLSRMKPGDTVCTISGGEVYVGEITGEAHQAASEGGRANLRRPAEWQDAAYPYHELPEELQQKLSIQHDVVDLSTVAALVAGLGRSDEELADEAEEAEGGTSAEDRKSVV